MRSEQIYTWLFSRKLKFSIARRQEKYYKVIITIQAFKETSSERTVELQ